MLRLLFSKSNEVTEKVISTVTFEVTSSLLTSHYPTLIEDLKQNERKSARLPSGARAHYYRALCVWYCVLRGNSSLLFIIYYRNLCKFCNFLMRIHYSYMIRENSYGSKLFTAKRSTNLNPNISL